MAVMSKVRVGVALAALVGGLAAGTGAIFGVGADRPEDKSQPPVAHVPGSPDATTPGAVVLRHGGAPFRHGSEIINVLVTPDGKTILTQGYANRPPLGRGHGSRPRRSRAARRRPGILDRVLTPDGKTLLTTRHNGTGQVWDLAARKMTRSFRLADPPFDVTGRNASIRRTGRKSLWSRAMAAFASAIWRRARKWSNCGVIRMTSPRRLSRRTGKRLIFEKGRNNQLAEWDVATGSHISATGRGTSAKNLRFSADGKLAAAAAYHPKRNGDKRAAEGDVSSMSSGGTRRTVLLLGSAIPRPIN